MTAPYLRIAEEIRQRIRAGQLRPGDRVPSAREITREWSVAIATATKVLATLGAEGLTQVVPGKGTLVAQPAAARPAAPVRRGGTREAEPALGRDRIVRTAIAIADADGLAEVSMRRIATALDVATMSLYRHVGSKDELVVHMIDAAIAEEPLPPPATKDWRADLAAIARLQWTVYRRHAWLAPAMSLTRPQLAPHAVAMADRVLGTLRHTGLTTSERLYVHLTLFSYTRGVASAFEPEAQAQQETGLTYDEWMQTQEAVLEAALPPDSPLREMTEQTDFDLDLDRLFEFGLTRLLDGIVASVADIRR